MNLTNVNFDEIWQDTMGWYDCNKNNRKFNDEIERSFWIKLAPYYTKNYNLNNDTDKIANKLYQLVGKGKSILEIGCGTGNFTMLMSKYSKYILGIDFSAAMLVELDKRIQEAKCNNVELFNSKWEDLNLDTAFDYIVSVNSLYRIRDIKNALEKMDTYAEKGVIIIRTIQKPFLYDLYKKCGIETEECMDYQIMPLLLWQHGIKANVEFIHYNRNKFYQSLDEAVKDMQGELSKPIFDKYKEVLISTFLKNAILNANGYEIKMPRTTVFIYWNKVHGKN